jgi:hypothetical protein
VCSLEKWPIVTSTRMRRRHVSDEAVLADRSVSNNPPRSKASAFASALRAPWRRQRPRPRPGRQHTRWTPHGGVESQAAAMCGHGDGEDRSAAVRVRALTREGGPVRRRGACLGNGAPPVAIDSRRRCVDALSQSLQFSLPAARRALLSRPSPFRASPPSLLFAVPSLSSAAVEPQRPAQ